MSYMSHMYTYLNPPPHISDAKKSKKQQVPGKGYSFYPEYPVVSSSTYLASLERQQTQSPLHPKFAKITNPSFNPCPAATAPETDVNTRNLLKCRVVNTHLPPLHPVVASVCDLFDKVCICRDLVTYLQIDVPFF